MKQCADAQQMSSIDERCIIERKNLDVMKDGVIPEPGPRYQGGHGNIASTRSEL